MGFRSAAVEPKRHVWSNNAKANKERAREVHSCLNNYIRTSKYTLLSFLPVNLIEQFMRAANFYFLCLLILQLIPQISSLTPVTTAMPLVIVLLATGIKDGNDDYKRHKSDRLVNNRKTHVLRNFAWKKVSWQHVLTGDIVKLEKDDFVPCDMVVLSSTEEDAACYIETADLDGETNLKKRFALTTTQVAQEVHELGNLDMEVKCDPPNNRLEDFQGTLYLRNGEPAPLSNENVVLRGCRIRNTKVVHGLAVYTGRDTKLMRNSGRVRFKRTHIDKQLNSLVLSIFIVLFCMCLIMAVLSANWERKQGKRFDDFIPQEGRSPDFIGFLQFWSYIIVLSNLVPISLYVSVELIRLGQSLFLGLDKGMYHEETDTPAVARTTTLNEELGQIDYVFSDKTGTLTQNVMRFLQCSVGGNIYGKEAAEGKPYEGFIDDRMQAALDKQDKNLDDFFRVLALCHTVRPEFIGDKVEYQAQSPDEKALVEAAREADFVFENRTSEQIYITVRGKRETYELLNIVQFNSTRKRMTVVLGREDGSIVAMVKGADNIMADLLSKESREKDWPVIEDHLHAFAREGLRTLVLAKRELDLEWYKKWAREFLDAETSLEDRDEKVAKVALRLECELSVVGASAIEDKLQDGVPETIARLMRGGLKIWVLTGDKQETAINIGFSCRLLKGEMEPLFIINGRNAEEVRRELEEAKRQMDQDSVDHRPYGLVITGPSLAYPLPPTDKEKAEDMVEGPNGPTLKWTPEALAQQTELKDLFVDVSTRCHSVLCCRVSPLQKAQVVRLIKRARKAVTLSIGDGANDVSMIKEAHIGVGISGLEGRQAVLASDYSIAQFRFLQRLLLVHGRWSYVRMATFLSYFFYKNFAYAFVHFWFGFFCGFSAMTAFDPVFISTFNVIYSSLPILVVGILEQDVKDKSNLEHPYLYQVGPRNLLFDRKLFYWSLFRGAMHGVAVFFVPMLAARFGGEQSPEGLEAADYYSLSLIFSCLLTWIVNLQLAIQTRFWTWMNAVTILIGPLTWFIFFAIQYRWDDWILLYQSPYFGAFNNVMMSTQFWASFFLAIGACMVPSMLEAFYKAWFYPTPIDIVRELEYLNRVHKAAPLDEIKPSQQMPTMTTYGFSQEDDVGRSMFPRIPTILRNSMRPKFTEPELEDIQSARSRTSTAAGSSAAELISRSRAGSTAPPAAAGGDQSARSRTSSSTALSPGPSALASAFVAAPVSLQKATSKPSSQSSSPSSTMPVGTKMSSSLRTDNV